MTGIGNIAEERIYSGPNKNIWTLTVRFRPAPPHLPLVCCPSRASGRWGWTGPGWTPGSPRGSRCGKAARTAPPGCSWGRSTLCSWARWQTPPSASAPPPCWSSLHETEANKTKFRNAFPRLRHCQEEVLQNKSIMIQACCTQLPLVSHFKSQIVGFIEQKQRKNTS